MDFSQLKESPEILTPLTIFLIRRNMVLGNQVFSGITGDVHYVHTLKELDLDNYKTRLKEKLKTFYILKAEIETRKLQIKVTDDLTIKHLLLLDIVQLYEEIEFLSL